MIDLETSRERAPWLRTLIVASLAGFSSVAAAADGALSINGFAVGRVQLAVQGLEGIVFEKCTAVRINADGGVSLECPGYNLQASAGATTPASTPAPTVPPVATRSAPVTPQPMTSASANSANIAPVPVPAPTPAVAGLPELPPLAPLPGPVAAPVPVPVPTPVATPTRAASYFIYGTNTRPGAVQYEVDVYVNGVFVDTFTDRSADPQVRSLADLPAVRLVPGANRVLMVARKKLSAQGRASTHAGDRLTVGVGAGTTERGHVLIERPAGDWTVSAAQIDSELRREWTFEVR